MSGDTLTAATQHGQLAGGHHDHAHEHHDDGSKTVVGFWMYLMGDCLIFAVLCWRRQQQPGRLVGALLVGGFVVWLAMLFWTAPLFVE